MGRFFKYVKSMGVAIGMAAMIAGGTSLECQAVDGNCNVGNKISCQELSQVQVNDNYQDLIMLPGESYSITVDYPEQVSSVQYTSSNTGVATVSQTGVIHVLAAGQATIGISGTDINGYTFSGTVYVYVPSLSTSTVNANLYGITANADGYYSLSEEINLTNLPSEASVTVTTSSQDLKAVYHNSYWGAYINLQTKKTGSYAVTISIDDKVFTAKINVRNLYFKRHNKTACDLVQYSSADDALTWQQGYSMLALYKGETATLMLRGLQSSDSVKWSSSNKAVATVTSQGKVKAKGYGYATVTATVGDFALTYEVGVSYKTAIKALRYDIKHFNDTYSQEKRMSEGYYDCSSFVWRGYKSAGMYLNKNGGWAPTAADLAKWCVQNNYMIYEGTVNVSKLLPGDLIFEMDASESNGRYKGIYHVDMYQGNGTLITVERQKWCAGQLSGVMVARPCADTPKLTAKKSGKRIKLSWTSVFGVTGYKVYRSTSKNGSYKLIATVKDAVTYKDTKAKKGKTYYYKVKAYWKCDGNLYKGKYSAVVKKKR